MQANKWRERCDRAPTTYGGCVATWDDGESHLFEGFCQGVQVGRIRGVGPKRDAGRGRASA